MFCPRFRKTSSHSAKNESSKPSLYPYMLQNPRLYTNTLPNVTPCLTTFLKIIPYFNTLPFILPKAGKLSTTNQIRARNPHQPIRKEYHNTEKHPTARGQERWPFSDLGSTKRLYPILINGWSSTPPHLTCSHIYYCHLFLLC